MHIGFLFYLFTNPTAPAQIGLTENLCKLLQLNFLQAGFHFSQPTNSIEALKGESRMKGMSNTYKTKHI